MLVELGCANLEHYRTTRDKHIKIISDLQWIRSDMCYVCCMSAVSPPDSHLIFFLEYGLSARLRDN